MAIDTLSPRLRQNLATALQQERERLLRRVYALAQAERALSESQGEESDAGGSSADVATDLAEATFDLTLERHERERLAEVEMALRRLHGTSYGVCERCHRAIPVERLFALPWTRHCTSCARSATATTSNARQTLVQRG